jgi:hypothetical protein
MKTIQQPPSRSVIARMRSPVRNSPSNARPTRDVTLASAVSTADDPLFNKKRVLFLTPLQQL